MSLATWLFIRNCVKSDTKRDAGLTTPADIKRFDNIQYGEDSKWHSRPYRGTPIGEFGVGVQQL